MMIFLSVCVILAFFLLLLLKPKAVASLKESQWDANTSRIIQVAFGSFFLGICFLPGDVSMYMKVHS